MLLSVRAQEFYCLTKDFSPSLKVGYIKKLNKCIKHLNVLIEFL